MIHRTGSLAADNQICMDLRQGQRPVLRSEHFRKKCRLLFDASISRRVAGDRPTMRHTHDRVSLQLITIRRGQFLNISQLLLNDSRVLTRLIDRWWTRGVYSFGAALTCTTLPRDLSSS